ncbi:MAG: lysylphosphatidylglycerol synthase transmembrane domain-containing protein [Candidatus Spechtbacterales bacterium]
MIKIFLGFASLVLGFAILGIVISSIGVGEIVRIFLQFSPWGIIPLVVLTFLGHIVSAMKWQYILASFGIRAQFMPLLKMWLAGYAISYLTPVAYIGGDFFRSNMLRERYGVSWPRALSSVFIDKTLEAAIWISVILVGAAVFVYQSGISSVSGYMEAAIVAVIVFGVFLTVVYIFVFQRKSLVRILFLKPFKFENSAVDKFLSDIEKDFFDFFSFSNRKYILGAMKITILKYIILWIRNIFLIFYLVKVFSLSASLMALGFSYLSYLAPVPAAIGVQEGLLSLVFSGVGFGASMGAVFSLLFRGAESIMVALGIFFLFRWGLSRFILRISKLLRPLLAKKQ